MQDEQNVQQTNNNNKSYHNNKYNKKNKSSPTYMIYTAFDKFTGTIMKVMGFGDGGFLTIYPKENDKGLLQTYLQMHDINLLGYEVFPNLYQSKMAGMFRDGDTLFARDVVGLREKFRPVKAKLLITAKEHSGGIRFMFSLGEIGTTSLTDCRDHLTMYKTPPTSIMESENKLKVDLFDGPFLYLMKCMQDAALMYRHALMISYGPRQQFLPAPVDNEPRQIEYNLENDPVGL